MKKDRPLKFDNTSKLIITEKVGQKEMKNVSTDEVYLKDIIETKVSKAEVNLGSINNPNTNIIEFEYKFPQTQVDFIRGWMKK